MLYIIESDGTALLGEAALFIPGYEYDSPVTPSDFDRLISGYRTLLRRRHWGTPTLLPIVFTLSFMGENDESKFHDFLASATQNSLPPAAGQDDGRFAVRAAVQVRSFTSCTMLSYYYRCAFVLD